MELEIGLALLLLIVLSVLATVDMAFAQLRSASPDWRKRRKARTPLQTLSPTSP
jgi:hypothetical protein